MADFAETHAAAASVPTAPATYLNSSVRMGSISLGTLVEAVGIFDTAAVFCSGLLAKFLYLSVYQGIADEHNYLGVILLSTLIFQFIARQGGRYDVGRIQNFSCQISSIIFLCATSFSITFVLLFFMKISADYSRIWFGAWVLICLCFLGTGRGLLAWGVDRLARKGALRRSVALIGSGPQFDALREMVSVQQRDFCLVNALDISAVRDTPADSATQSASAVDVEVKNFIRQAQRCKVDEVIIALPASEGTRLEAVVRQVQMLPVDVQVLPDFGGAQIPLRHVYSSGGFSLITTVCRPISDRGAFLKWLEDYALASIGLILALPVMVLIAIAIKLESGGPVFFRQRRYGYNHRIIEVLKFRSMTVLEDGMSVTQATRNDKRVTRAGRFLRRTSLDELPQLINVLRGEMSIVGPRPHALAHNTYYGDLIENYANRHRVKPGMTGWAQVHGFRGETSHPNMMAGRVRYDLDYIENWSIWLDLKIIIMTPLFGLFRHGAY
jgi:Undecaprenyl-phosphate glucose phosphotransferase